MLSTLTALVLAITSAGLLPALQPETPAPPTKPVVAAVDPAKGSTVQLPLSGIDPSAIADLPSVAPQAEDAPTSRRAAAEPTAPDVLTAPLDTADYSVLGLTWDHPDAAADDAVIRYRVRQAGSWSEWEATTASDIAPDPDTDEARSSGTRSASDAIVALHADGLQVWAESDSGSVSGLQAVLIDPGTRTTDADPSAVQTSSSSGEATVRTAALVTATGPASPTIISRAGWGADESKRNCQPDLSAGVVAAAVHHTASTTNYTVADVPALIRGFYEYHTRSEAAGGRGWCDIGYNFLVDQFGRVFEGRAGGTNVDVVGVHTGGFNSRTFGVAAIGTYTSVAPKPAMTESISRLIAWKFAMHRISGSANVTMVSGGGASKYPAGTSVVFHTIFGHRDAQQTSCPGQRLYDQLGNIRARVSALADAAVKATPMGSWDGHSTTATTLSVGGWAIDPDTSASLTVRVAVDGVDHSVVADIDRPDVERAIPGYGSRHGYSLKISASSGRHAVCVRVTNVGAGADRLLGCRWMTVQNALPTGQLDSVRLGVGTATVSGWALDPDTKNPIAVHVYVDSRGTQATANRERPDLARYYSTTNHGYQVTVPFPAGKHRLCVYAINVPAGNNPALSCRYLTMPDRAPVGQVDSVKLGVGTATVSGWALDPDTTNPIAVHVYVDSGGTQATANRERPDLARYYSTTNHGYQVKVQVPAGRHRICVYAIDVPAGNNPLLSCRDVTMPDKPPVGQLDSVSVKGTVATVSGWAVDPDTKNPIAVHVYVDSRGWAGRADLERPDLAPYFSTTNHGYRISVYLPAGTHRLCVYAIDVPVGNNPALGCRTLTR